MVKLLMNSMFCLFEGLYDNIYSYLKINKYSYNLTLLLKRGLVEQKSKYIYK